MPSSSVTPTVTGSRAHDASPSEASSKSDGRMPMMTLRPRYPSSPGLASNTAAGTGSV